jgi:hypothetical protein
VIDSVTGNCERRIVRPKAQKRADYTVMC